MGSPGVIGGFGRTGETVVSVPAAACSVDSPEFEKFFIFSVIPAIARRTPCRSPLLARTARGKSHLPGNKAEFT
jgi:hypothetical protein